MKSFLAIAALVAVAQAAPSVKDTVAAPVAAPMLAYAYASPAVAPTDVKPASASVTPVYTPTPAVVTPAVVSPAVVSPAMTSPTAYPTDTSVKSSATTPCANQTAPAMASPAVGQNYGNATNVNGSSVPANNQTAYSLSNDGTQVVMSSTALAVAGFAALLL